EDARTTAARAAVPRQRAEQAHGREVALVDVVGEADQREPRRAAQHRVVAAALVAVAVAVAAVDLAARRLLDPTDAAHRLLPPAVGAAAERGLVGGAVVDLDAAHALGRQVAHRRGRVAAEERPAVHQPLLHVLAVRLDLAVLHGHARHLLPQLLG